MAQETHFVNCPHCSAIIEVVCPRHDTKVREVFGTTSWNHGGAIEIKMYCPKCSDRFKVVWRF